MKILESKFYDLLNIVLGKIQNKTDNLRKSSLILSSLDKFIFLFLVLTVVSSLFVQSDVMGMISFAIPLLVCLKVLITKGEKIELEKSNFFLLIYLFICFITNFTSSMLPQSLYGYMKTLIYFAFYFALCHFLKTNKKYILPIMLLVALCISFESIVGLIQNTLGLENIATWQDTSYVNPEHVLSRVYGTLKPYNPNLYAAFLLVGMPSLLALGFIYLKTNLKKFAIIPILLFFATCFSLFISGWRGAYIGLFAIFIGIVIASFIYIFNDKNNEKLKSLWKKLFLIFSGLGLAFLLLNQSILKRLLSIFILRGDSSTSFRMNVYSSSVQMFQDNWLCGIGVGNKVFREIYGLYMLSGFDALSCYCVFLEIAVESGIFALIAFLLFLGTLLTNGVVAFIRNKDYNIKVLIFATFISVLAVMIHGFVDTVFYRPQVQYLFWIMVSILTVLTREETTTN